MDPAPDNSPQYASSSPGPSSHLDEARTRHSKRSKRGCLTCRLRKKRCDETRPVCATCTRLGLDCLGFSDRRPDWMRKQEVVSNIVAGMYVSNVAFYANIRKRSASASYSAKMNAHWSDKAAKRLALEKRDTAPLVRSPDEAPQLEASPEFDDATALIRDLSDVLSYPAPQAEMVDTVDCAIPLSLQNHTDPPSIQTEVNNAEDIITVPSRSPSPPGPLIDPALLALLGFEAQVPNKEAAFLFSLMPHPVTTLETAFGTSFISSPGDMRYFHHYLTVIMPYQWIFERKVLADLVAPLAIANPVVFESLVALAALHMGAKRKRACAAAQVGYVDNVSDTDLAVAETSLSRSIQRLRKANFNEFGTHEMVVATMSVSSFHLFDGGNRRGWTEAVDLCRKSLAAILQGRQDWNSADPGCKLKLSAVVKRFGHLLSPLIWTDILTSVTEGVTSQFVSVYRILLLDDQSEEMGQLLRETVMGCDSTTRLAIAETIALGEWKDKARTMGCLSIRDLMERAASIERLLAQRRWRERHLFDSEDPATLQRRAVSNVFFHSAKVLLATIVNGSYPGVVEVASEVRETAEAFRALDLLNLSGAERALVFPAVIAGCHASNNGLQQFFKDRFLRLGEEAVAFGNTRNALRLMEEVWKRREVAQPGEEIHWRKVMFELDEEGLLLI